MAVLGDALRQCGELTKVVASILLSYALPMRCPVLTLRQVLSNNVDGLYVQDGPWSVNDVCCEPAASADIEGGDGFQGGTVRRAGRVRCIETREPEPQRHQ